MEDPRYGPKFGSLTEVIAKLDLKPVIISENPLLDEDAKKMRDIVRGAGNAPAPTIGFSAKSFLQ